MSFPRYGRYKDSGIEWLGEVPEHWEIYALKRIASLKSGDTINSDSIEEIGDFPVFGGNGLRGFTTSYTHEGTYTLIGRQGALCGNINYAHGKFWASEHAVVVSPIRVVETLWLGELLRAMNLNQYSISAAQPGLSVEIVGNLNIPVPPHTEQQAIATFLDRETTKIDALIAEQQRLIELLKEKRQAVISHAVTKGLDPNMPMKDSGVEWLGEVPEHWQVTRVGYYATIENGTTPSRDNPDYWFEGTIPWLSSGEVNQYHITESEEYITENALKNCSLRLLPKGTVVVGMIGQGKTRGLSAYLEIEACINQNLAALIPNHYLDAEYLHYTFQSMYIYLREFGRGGNQAALNCEILSATRIAIPPLDEQKHISHCLQQILQKLNELTTEAQTAITLLQERRTALISAAVTGKIDVRRLVETSPEEETAA